MNKILTRKSKNVKTVRIEAACARYGVGRNTMRKIAENAGADIHIGRNYLINISKVDKYMNDLSGIKRQ